jgi:hypothetical protein
MIYIKTWIITVIVIIIFLQMWIIVVIITIILQELLSSFKFLSVNICLFISCMAHTEERTVYTMKIHTTGKEKRYTKQLKRSWRRICRRENRKILWPTEIMKWSSNFRKKIWRSTVKPIDWQDLICDINQCTAFPRITSLDDIYSYLMNFATKLI